MLAKNRRGISLSPLNKYYKEKRVYCPTKCMKTDFTTLILIDKCRATLDGPDDCGRS